MFVLNQNIVNHLFELRELSNKDLTHEAILKHHRNIAKDFAYTSIYLFLVTSAFKGSKEKHFLEILSILKIFAIFTFSSNLNLLHFFKVHTPLLANAERK